HSSKASRGPSGTCSTRTARTSRRSGRSAGRATGAGFALAPATCWTSCSPTPGCVRSGGCSSRRSRLRPERSPDTSPKGSWAAGTVHARQGTEADVVVFDTVNAGSCGWPYDEWKRLVNVGLSRAREFVLILASRAEMSEPYLRPLLDTLAPRVLKRTGRAV